MNFYAGPIDDVKTNFALGGAKVRPEGDTMAVAAAEFRRYQEEAAAEVITKTFGYTGKCEIVSCSAPVTEAQESGIFGSIFASLSSLRSPEAVAAATPAPFKKQSETRTV